MSPSTARGPESAAAIVPRALLGSSVAILVLGALLNTQGQTAGGPVVVSWVAVAWALGPFLVYLAYAHPPHWAAYYHETQTILAFVTALGIWRALTTIVSASWRSRNLLGRARDRSLNPA